jgi:hypothetical protein
MVGMVLVKSLYVLPTWTRTVALVTEHAVLRQAIGCPEAADAPSVHACYRFTRKLREHKGMLDSCIAAVIASLGAELPGFGDTIAIDGSDPSGLRQRSAVPFQPRPGARAVLRPRRVVGTSQRHLDSQGWRLLGVQGPRCR